MLNSFANSHANSQKTQRTSPALETLNFIQRNLNAEREWQYTIPYITCQNFLESQPAKLVKPVISRLKNITVRKKITSGNFDSYTVHERVKSP